MPKGQYIRTQFHRDILIKRNKDPKHIAKVKKALMGHGFSEETLQKMRDNHADTKGEKNPNWKGNKVGIIGIHIWLRKNFTKKLICEFCGKNEKSGRKIEWAKINNKKYERKRENFIELCCKCHRNYDDVGFKKGNKINLGRKHRRNPTWLKYQL